MRRRQRVTLYRVLVDPDKWADLESALFLALSEIGPDATDDIVPGVEEWADSDDKFAEWLWRSIDHVMTEVVTAAVPFLDGDLDLAEDHVDGPTATDRLYRWFVAREEQHGLMSTLVRRAIDDGVVDPPVETVIVRRKAIGKATRARIVAQHGNRCAKCHAGDVELQIDHRTPWAISHDDSDSNLWPLCEPCHRAKTSKDLIKVHDHRARERRAEQKRTRERQRRRSQAARWAEQ